MGEFPKLSGVTSQPIMIDRRKFMLTAAAAGGGLMIGLSPASEASAAVSGAAAWEFSEGAEFTAMLTILPDNTVVVRSTSPDIGNGTFTASPMMVTEELRCDWANVRGEYVPANRDVKDDGLYSSSGALAFFAGRSTGAAAMKQVLQLGASTRERLREAAAARWDVDVEQVTADKGMLTNGSDGKTLTYGDVAAEAAGILLIEEPAPTPREEWTFLGKASPPKIQRPELLNGRAIYGIDVQVPGMVYAALRQVPAQGGRLKSVDADAVLGMPGVRKVVVVDPDEIRPGLPEGKRAPFGLSATNTGPQAAVAVIADHYWQAQTALDLLPVEWDSGDGAKWTTTQTIYDALLQKLETPEEPNVVRKQGDMAAADGPMDFESTFYTPYMDHFNMEPLNGTALVTSDRVDIWMPSQHPLQGLFVVADETGVHPDDVHIHQTWVGTGLGRRVYGNDTRMVAAVAKQMPDTPVKVVWSREESLRQGRYRVLLSGKLGAKVDAQGMPETVMISAAGAGVSGRALADSPYQTNVPNWKVQTQSFDSNLMTGPWRGPVYNSNCFMLETFINELAESAKIDAIDYRRKLLANYEDKSWIKLLDVVGEKSGWGNELPRGMAQGVAIGNWGMGVQKEGGPTPFSGTTIAVVVTAELSRRGEIRIPRVDLAVDTGSYINAGLVRQMMEGGIVLSLGAAMHEEINVRDGRVVEGNLDTYSVIRQNDPLLPEEIHVHLDGMSMHERFSEAGEPPMGPPPPALAHAIYKLSGTWMRSHPFSKIDLG